jgi:hypothetical protein
MGLPVKHLARPASKFSSNFILANWEIKVKIVAAAELQPRSANDQTGSNRFQAVDSPRVGFQPTLRNPPEAEPFCCLNNLDHLQFFML